MNNAMLLVNEAVNRSCNASDGYTRFYFSRAALDSLIFLVENDPKGLARQLKVCLSQRGSDKRLT